MHPDVRLLGGRYELGRLIATGGMGQVFEAHDHLLARDVAVKVLRSEYTGDPTFIARFRAEAQLAAGLVHPNIAALFDYGEVPAADPRDEHLAYLVMELVRGESLSAMLRREHRLSPDRTLHVLRQCAAGLAAAHAAGVVHRDVKPGNVLIGADGTVKITDFGVAVSGASVPLTQTGQVIGTAHYLSPEQAGGSRATPASDVYALGVVGYECLAGHRLFDGESSVQVALMQLRTTPAPLPDDVPPQVRQLIDAALTKDPAERFPDGAAFRDAIDDVVAGRPLHHTLRYAPTSLTPLVEVPSTQPRGLLRTEPDDEPEGRRRRRALVPLLALPVLAAVVAGGIGLAGNTGDGTEATAATSAPTSSAAPSVQLVALTSSDYLDRPVTEVQTELTALGLLVTLRPLQTTDVPDGRVIALDQVGQLTPGSPVTVTYAVAPPPAVVPTPDPTAESAPGSTPDPTPESTPDPAPAPSPTPDPAPAPAPVPDTSITVVDSGAGGGTGGGTGGGAPGDDDDDEDAGDNGSGKGNGKDKGNGDEGGKGDKKDKG